MDTKWTDDELSQSEEDIDEEDQDENINNLETLENVETVTNIPKKKERKKSSGLEIPKIKLDLTRILGDKGFRFLLSKAENYFEFKGKGYETSDLNKIISLYQEWAHSLYPRLTFYDVIKTIEKKCHSKLAQVCMNQWHDYWQRGETLFDLVTREQQASSNESILTESVALNDSITLSSDTRILTEEQLAMIEERRMAAMQRLESRGLE